MRNLNDRAWAEILESATTQEQEIEILKCQVRVLYLQRVETDKQIKNLQALNLCGPSSNKILSELELEAEDLTHAYERVAYRLNAPQ